MRKIFTMTALAVSCLMTSRAQERPFGFEIQAGAMLSGPKDSPGFMSPSVGFYSRGLVDFRLNRIFSLQSGLGYRQENYQFETGTFYAEDRIIPYQEFDVKRHVLEIPFHLKVSFVLANQDQLSFYAGPYISMITGGQFRNVETGEVSSYRFDKFADRIDYGIDAGVSYVFRRDWTLSAGYTQGIKDHDPNGAWSIRNQGFYLGLGRKF